MKKLHTGLIVLDRIDVICMSFSAGSMLAYVFKKYKDYRRIKITGEDIIVEELKKKSSINMVSEKGNPLKLPLFRGGDGDAIRGISLIIKNKKLVQFIRVMVTARKNQRKLRLLQYVFFILNGLLTTSTGLRIVAGGSLSYAQIVLIAFPSTVGGFMTGIISQYPLTGVLLPIVILFSQGIEDVPDPYEKCKFICKTAENYHNHELMLEMKNLDSLLVDTAPALQLPIDKVSLLCTEQPFSLLQRYRLKEVIKSEKVRQRVQHFSEFIKKFPECDADSEAVYQKVIGNVKKIL